MTAFLLYLPWMGCGLCLVIMGFLIARCRRLQLGHHDLQNVKQTLQESLMKECERRAIAEEKTTRLSDLEKVIQSKETLIEKLLSDQSELRSRLIEKTSLYEQEKLAFLQHVQQHLADSFKVLSTDAFNHNIQTFLELATARFEKLQDHAQQHLDLRHQAMDHLLQPFQSSLQTIDQKIADLERARVVAYTSLTEQVHALAKTQSQLHLETANLGKALRMPHVRGRWGEIQLKRVVEMAGMVEHCDFTRQESLTVDERRLRPDLIIRLPNSKQVVVDAKAPLQAYLEALDCLEDLNKIHKLKEHARHIRMHITQLAAKAYWDQFPSAPEFVVLFLPGEPFFSAALEQDPELIEWGVEQRVILSTPTTLIALLRAVAYGWRQESMAANAQKMSELGRTLHDRLHVLVEYFEDMRKGLDRAVEGYNKAVGCMESRVLITARKFKELGVTAQDDLPLLEPLDIHTRTLN
jgi:DNA recombination protein RmuC